jgi:hypothetical protein
MYQIFRTKDLQGGPLASDEDQNDVRRSERVLDRPLPILTRKYALRIEEDRGRPREYAGTRASGPGS